MDQDVTFISLGMLYLRHFSWSKTKIFTFFYKVKFLNELQYFDRSPFHYIPMLLLFSPLLSPNTSPEIYLRSPLSWLWYVYRGDARRSRAGLSGSPTPRLTILLPGLRCVLGVSPSVCTGRLNASCPPYVFSACTGRPSCAFTVTHAFPQKQFYCACTIHSFYAVPVGSAEGGERPLRLSPGCCCHHDILYSLHYAFILGETGQERWMKMGKLW